MARKLTIGVNWQGRIDFKGLIERAKIAEHCGEPLVNGKQTARQRQIFRRLDRTAPDVNQTVAFDFDHAPAGAAQAGVDA